MAAELKGEWSLTEVTKSGVTSKTASYKINGKEVIKLTNLSSNLTVDETTKTIAGLTVDEDNKTVTLSGSALNEQTVAFTSSTYKLELDNVPAVEFTDVKPTVASGKATFTGGWSAGYTLSVNGKTLTYTKENSDQLLATVSGLATNADDSNVVYDDGVITLSPDALKAANVSLKLKNGAAFTLAIDDDVQKIEAGGTWTFTNGTATLKGTVTQDGYAVAPDGKSVNYLKANANTATLAIVKGLNTTYTDNMDVATAVDENGNYIITLPQAALNAKDVTVSGTGYALALEDGSVPTSETVEKTDEWTVSGTTATYNQVMPEHYDVSGAKVVYTKAATVQTYAKVTGLKSGLTASGETVTDGSNEVITVRGKEVITLAEGALTTTNVTLTSDDYSLELDNVQGAEIDSDSGVWSLSGKTGGIYKAKVTTPGWGLKDSKTVTYTATSNSAVVGTITGLKSGVTKDKLENIKVENGEFNVPADLLTNSDVTLTNGNGFGYSLATDADTAENVHSWTVADVTDAEGNATSATAKLFYGKSAYYVASDDGTTLAYNKPESGSSVATIQFLKAGTTADDMPTDEEIELANKKYTIPLSADVLTTKTVTLTGSNYVLALDEDLSAKANQLIWDYADNKKNDTTATLSTYKTEGWAPNTGGTRIEYTAPVKGATLATLTGFKSGLKQIGDGEYDTVGETTPTRIYNNFTSGITVYTEATTETITGSKTGETERKYAANTIAIEKAAVVDGITLTNSAYSLAVGKDLTNSTATDGWTFDPTKGTATYTYTTPAGYSVEESGTTSTLNVEKATKLTATLTGLNVSDETAQKAVEALAVDKTEHIITLTKSVLDGKPVTVKGNYTLNADDIDEPKLGTPTWDMSKKGTAILYGAYTVAGYTLDSKGTTLTYTQPADGTKKLATVSGLDTIANASSDGLALKGTTVTLSSNVLGTSKITIKNETGSDYKLALNASDKNIATEAKTETAWTVKGTTATLQTSSTAYYSQDENTGAIIYNKPGNATVHATVSGLLKDAEIDTNTDYNSTTKTLTLTTDMLGTAAQVKLTDKDGVGYKLALDGDVPTSAKEYTEWVRSGTKATYQTYTKGYYTKASDTQINYTKDKDVTVHLTLNGIQADIDDSALDETEMTVTLNAEQLNDTKNKVTTKLTTSKAYTGYTIALDGDVTVPDSDKATWTVDGKGKANYIQKGTANTFVLDAAGTTVTYYDTETPLTLATLSGLNKNITDDAFADVTVEDGVITLTDDVLKTDAANKSTKVSVSTKGYTLAIDSNLEPKTTDLGWDFSALAKSGTVTKNNQLGEGYIVDTKGTSVSYSAAKDKNTVITLSGLNKNYGGGQTAAAAGITVDDTNKKVTLSKADLLTTSKITLKNGTGASYTLDVDEDVLGEKELDAETAVWTLKGTTATLSVGKSAYYKQNEKSATTVDYIKEVANTPVATLSGLGKTAKVDGGKLGYLNNKVFTQGVFINQDTSDGNDEKTYNISFYPEVLGTTDVTLSNTAGSGYTYNLTADNLSAPQEGENIWKYDASKGTATLTQTVVAGWTLNSTADTLEYKEDKDNAVLTTFSGLSKTFEGDIDDALSTPTSTNDTITVKDPDLLGTGTASLKNATGYTYSLALGDKIPNKTQSETAVTKWLTSGAKASYKTYYPAYYSINDKGAIVYNNAVDVKGAVYAEVSGIAKDVDIRSCVSGDGFKDVVITLGADQLADKNVTLTNKTVGTNTASFKLALGEDSLKATLGSTATWATKNGTATLTGNVTKGYTLSADGLKLTYAKNDTTPVIATIKGVNVTLEGSYNTSNTTFTLGADSLTSVVTIDGKEIFDFKFSKGYDGAKITGAATADTINAAGDSLNINTGNGNDVVTVSGASVTLTAGAGDDTISISGGNASINAGAGNDSIKSGGGNNTFYYATGYGSDTITGFATTDRIMTNAKATAISAENLNGNAVITIGAGTKNASTITLTGKGNSVSSISIVDTKNNAITPSYAAASDVLLADNNYNTDAAALTDITDAFHASYTPYDFETGLDLVKKDSLAPVVSYMGDDK